MVDPIRMVEAGKLARRLLSVAIITHLEKDFISTNGLLRAFEQKRKDLFINNFSFAPPELGFPSSICISAADCVAHGVPNFKHIDSRTWVNIDVSIKSGGVYADVGTSINKEIYQKTGKNTNPAKTVFDRVFKQLYVGMPAHHVSALIEIEAKRLGLNPVRGLMSHGIGTKLHMTPFICNYITGGTEKCLEPYTFLALEPVVTEGSGEVYVDEDDGWSIRTKDGKQAWQHEQTIFIGDGHIEIIT